MRQAELLTASHQIIANSMLTRHAGALILPRHDQPLLNDFARI
jgi:hypothetical protein